MKLGKEGSSIVVLILGYAHSKIVAGDACSSSVRYKLSLWYTCCYHLWSCLTQAVALIHVLLLPLILPRMDPILCLLYHCLPCDLWQGFTSSALCAASDTSGDNSDHALPEKVMKPATRAPQWETIKTIAEITDFPSHCGESCQTCHRSCLVYNRSNGRAYLHWLQNVT